MHFNNILKIIKHPIFFVASLFLFFWVFFYRITTLKAYRSSSNHIEIPQPPDFNWLSRHELKYQLKNSKEEQNLPSNCVHSNQGAHYIVDSKGFLCPTENLQASGCCSSLSDSLGLKNTERSRLHPRRQVKQKISSNFEEDDLKNSLNRKKSRQFVCDSCQPSNCCAIFEHCVSCCLKPGTTELWRRVLQLAAEQKNILLTSIQEPFGFCLAKCRTSSEVSDILCENLSEKVRSQFDKADRKQMLLLLVGSTFRNKYLEGEALDPLILGMNELLRSSNQPFRRGDNLKLQYRYLQFYNGEAESKQNNDLFVRIESNALM